MERGAGFRGFLFPVSQLVMIAKMLFESGSRSRDRDHFSVVFLVFVHWEFFIANKGTVQAAGTDREPAQGSLTDW